MGLNKRTFWPLIMLLGMTASIVSKPANSEVKPSFVNITTGSVHTDNDAYENNRVYALSIGHQISYFTIELGHQQFSKFYIKGITDSYIDDVSGSFLNIGLAIPINSNMGLEPYIGVYTWEMKSIRHDLLWKESKGDSAQMGLDYYLQLMPDDLKVKIRFKFGIQYMEKLSGPNVTQGQFGVQLHF